MKKLASLLALMVCMAGAAHAQGGINLGNLDCFTGANNAVVFACNTSTGTALQLNGSVQAPAQVDNFVAIEAVLDVQVAAASLPAWWQLGAVSGQCRNPSLSISADFTAGPANCNDYWAGQGIAAGGVAGGSFGPSRIRLAAAVAVPAPQILDADTEYGVIKFNISRARTTGATACAGCTTPACLVLNEIKLVQPAGFGDTRVSNPIANNFVTWQAGAPSCPGATPTQNKTWGAVKALYR